MKNNNIKKKIAAGSLAAIIGATSGIAIDRSINNKTDSELLKKDGKGIIMLYDVEYRDKSYILGGAMGHYDYLKQNKYDPTNNDYYRKYSNYFDKDEYKAGYIEGYQEEGMFKDASERDLLYNADITSIAFSLMSKNLIINKYYTNDYDKAIKEVDKQLESIQKAYDFSIDEQATTIKKAR